MNMTPCVSFRVCVCVCGRIANRQLGVRKRPLPRDPHRLCGRRLLQFVQPDDDRRRPLHSHCAPAAAPHVAAGRRRRRARRGRLGDRRRPAHRRLRRPRRRRRRRAAPSSRLLHGTVAVDRRPSAVRRVVARRTLRGAVGRHRSALFLHLRGAACARRFRRRQRDVKYECLIIIIIIILY